MSSAGGVTLAPAVSEVTNPTALQSGCGETVLLPESFRGGCSFGDSSAYEACVLSRYVRDRLNSTLFRSALKNLKYVFICNIG